MTTRAERSERAVSPVLAFILSLIPGVGQIYIGQRGRGLAVLIFVPVMIVLALWRMTIGGVGFIGPATQAPTVEEVRAAWGLGIFLALTDALVYVWSILDTLQTVRSRRP